MSKPYNDPVFCTRCGDIFQEGDDYYDTPFGDYCPDCFDAIVRDWKRYVGDTIERC